MNEERLDLVEQVRPEIGEGVPMSMRMRMRVRGHRQEAVVAFPLPPAFALADLKPADQERRHHATGRRAVNEEYQHVERIAVFALGRGDEAEIVRERQPLGEHGAEPQGAALAIVFILVKAALFGLTMRQ